MTSTRWILVLSLGAALTGLTMGSGCPTPTPTFSVSVATSPTSTTPGGTVSATATPSGGTAPYTYQWSSSPSTGVTISAPTAATTNVTFTTANTYTLSCTVTDSTGATASDSAQVAVGTTPTGDPAAGQAIVNARCVGCHVTGGIAAPLTKASASAVVTNLGTLSPLMASITLTSQEVLDIKAYLNTLP